MSKTAEEFVFKKYGTTKTSNDGKLQSKILPTLTNSQWYELMESYHASKLSEVKGLPSDNEIKSEFESKGYDPADAYFIMAKWMRTIAQQVIAKKDEELNNVRISKEVLALSSDALFKENVSLSAELRSYANSYIDDSRRIKNKNQIIEQLRDELNKAKEEIKSKGIALKFASERGIQMIEEISTLKAEIDNLKEASIEYIGEVERLKGIKFCSVHAKELDKFGRCSLCNELLYVSK